MEYNAGIYLRLSHEDTEKSNSIENQRYIIEQYAKKNGFEIVKEYIDNGISGLLQNRPAFQLLLKDIENKSLYFVILLLTVTAGTMVSSMGVFLGPVMLFALSLVDLICYRRIGNGLRAFACIIPCILQFALYIWMRY